MANNARKPKQGGGKTEESAKKLRAKKKPAKSTPPKFPPSYYEHTNDA